MAIVKSKPTSAGSRFVVRVKNDELHKGKPFAQLLDKNISITTGSLILKEIK